ncbi:1527_t:CDS:2 [Racocetra fulgida]|uniref:1527_t:CDS:1 n=1 Tax=Racocetra fulgida TaxID=60492 RepID=A0A9N9DGD0_9GLOM|nr:1527_t:CDS:2 [Racocetra fulgida]
MANVIDLKKELYNALQDSSEIVSYNAKLRDKYEKQEKKINRERGRWDRDRKKWSKKLGGVNTEIQKLRTYDLELIDEARRQ